MKKVRVKEKEGIKGSIGREGEEKRKKGGNGIG